MLLLKNILSSNIRKFARESPWLSSQVNRIHFAVKEVQGNVLPEVLQSIQNNFTLKLIAMILL